MAENAGGNKVVKYGPTGSSVLAMEVVLADGTVTWFGGKRRKDVTGYDFVHLMVGSEGTLGLITRIILKLLPLPAFGVDLLVPFPTVDAAIRFVPRIALEGRVVPAFFVWLARAYLPRRMLYTARPSAMCWSGAPALQTTTCAFPTRLPRRRTVALAKRSAAGAGRR